MKSQILYTINIVSEIAKFSKSAELQHSIKIKPADVVTNIITKLFLSRRLITKLPFRLEEFKGRSTPLLHAYVNSRISHDKVLTI